MPRLRKSAPKSAKKGRMQDEMHKFKSGTLKSSSGSKVSNPKQAVAIGLSESGQSKAPQALRKAKAGGPTPKQKAMRAATKKRPKIRNIGRR